MSQEEASCRICHAASAARLGQVEYFSGFAWTVFRCSACGCGFTRHDNSIYDQLHASGAIHYYRDYQDLAARCQSAFQKRDAAALRAALVESAKYRFIIEEIERRPANATLLEVGCSRGYLTSYFILTGRKVLGVDISAKAVQSAREAFGDSFALAGAPAIQASAPFDIIYHVGMIGCVEDPIQFTSDLLGLLRPGGRLLFNAPNVQSCYYQGQLWLDSAPPPDVVTLFSPGFWSKGFAKVADVTEAVEMRPADQSFEVGFRKLLRRRWQPPVPVQLDQAGESKHHSFGQPRKIIERAVLKAARLTRATMLAPRQPSEFGLYVKMTKS